MVFAGDRQRGLVGIINQPADVTSRGAWSIDLRLDRGAAQWNQTDIAI